MERFGIVRRGFDARRRSDVRRVYTAEIALRSEGLERRAEERLPSARRHEAPPDPFPREAVRAPSLRPVVVGAGPAGLFAALTLARFGAPPVLIERGKPVEERSRDAAAFWASGALDPESNVAFGEGGAGTFSDGKLTTRIGDPLVGWVVETFEAMAGIPGLSLEARPHVGTDRLRIFCRAMRAELLRRGAEIRFGARLADLAIDGRRVRGARLASGEEIPCDHVVLAIGNAARDTVRRLAASGVGVSPKPFAVGFRVEHRQELVDRIQYGRRAGHPSLPPADYRLATRAPSGRGVYSFCMCPGGEVVAAASSPGELPVNGMSAFGRDSGYANAGIVAAVAAPDFDGADAFAGVRFQEAIERRAFERGGGGFGVPAENLLAFLGGERAGPARGRVRAPRAAPASLRGILPPAVEEDLRNGLRAFGVLMRGFLTAEATLYAVESRTSSPVRIERTNFESVAREGLYPVGEGAGYAGGIVSSAVDGIRGALRILEKLSG